MRWHGLTLEDYGHYDGEATAREIRSRARLAKMYEKGNSTVCSKEWGKKEFCKDLEGRYKNTIRKKKQREGIIETDQGRPGIHFQTTAPVSCNTLMTGAMKNHRISNR